MSNAMDKLIAEIRKRPALWDFESEEYVSCSSVAEVWKEVAAIMGTDVGKCQQNWTNLCKKYRKTFNRWASRLQKEKLNGKYDPNRLYISSWEHFDAMEFMKDIKPAKLRASPDKLKLIAEMRKRPALWDFQSEEHKSCSSVSEVWEDLAASTGSDVVTCQKNWTQLIKVYRSNVRRIELHIKLDKFKGLYDPNNDYSSKWPFFKAMQFMKDSKGGPIKPRNSSDKLKLIAEIEKRPALWDFHNDQYKSRINVQKTWKDLARTMESDVESCKRKWKTLRNAYREEANRIELRIKQDKLKGSYDPNNDYSSNWVFFGPMKIIEDIKKKNRDLSSNNNNSDDNNSQEVSQSHNVRNSDLESDEIDKEVYVCNEISDEDDDTSNQIYSENKADKMQQSTLGTKLKLSGQNSPRNQEQADDKPTSTSRMYAKRSYDQANLMENIEKQGKNLKKLARMDKLRSNNMVNVNDCDYNFLVSFLPQMKKMSVLQNTRVRAKMTNLMLNIKSTINDKVSVLSSQN